MSEDLPDWLLFCFQSALISGIYHETRALTVEILDNRVLMIRYYLDREAADFGHTSIQMLVNEILSNTSSTTQIQSITEKFSFSNKKMAEIDRFDGLVYTRRKCL